MLDDPHVQLLPFVVLCDRMSKKECYTVPDTYIDRLEGMVYWPASTLPKLSKPSTRDGFYHHIVKKRVPVNTIKYPFDNTTYQLHWKAYAMKAVFKDFGENAGIFISSSYSQHNIMETYYVLPATFSLCRFL